MHALQTPGYTITGACRLAGQSPHADHLTGMSAGAHVAAAAAPDEEINMDEQDMDQFLLELHGDAV